MANGSSLGQQPFGKTLNVPHSAALQALPGAPLPAPLNPQRPAIMTKPRSATATIKSPTKPAGAGRPVLLVTTGNDQRQPETTTVPNSRRLPLNGRIVTIGSSKPRSQAPVSTMDHSHQTVNEIVGRKPVTQRARPAVFYTPKSKSNASTNTGESFMMSLIMLAGADSSLEQRQPLLSNGNNSNDSLPPTDDSWSDAPR